MMLTIMAGTPRPIVELSESAACLIRYVLMDIDDTLTDRGKLGAAAYAALWRLKDAGLVVIPVTGRPAGWCDLIAREWPVDGVIGENGALAFWEEAASQAPVEDSAPGAAWRPPILRQAFHPEAISNDHPSIHAIRERALAEIPGLRVAKDQFTRRYDLALDFAEEEPVLGLAEARRVKLIAEEAGAEAKISSIHVNVWMGRYDKLSMARRFLSERFSWDEKTELDQVLFVGDSPNDAPMFAFFPAACAVANFRRYAALMDKAPAFITTAEGGAGFAELVSVLLNKRAWVK